MSRAIRRISAAALLALAVPAHGQQGEWAYCEPISRPSFENDLEPGVSYVDADRLTAQRGGVSTFTGNVTLRRDQRRVTGDEAIYNQLNDTATLIGNIRYETPDARLFGERAELQLEEDSGRIHDARFRFISTRANGTADLVEIITPEFTRMESATYSTCDPDNQVWALKAGSFDLDEATNTGEAWNVRVNVKGVPIFYTPYLNFPLEGRKSGFLAPSYGSSETGGTDLSIPYYWNIAPHRDATFTPRYIENRGTMLYSEFRYLNPDSSGQIAYDFLNDDSLFGDDRSFLRIDQKAHWNRWSSDLLYQEVSDAEYFEDISNRQGLTSQTHLERHLNLDYRADWWSFLGRVQEYQPLSGTAAYQRQPQLVFDFSPPRGTAGLEWGGHAELVHFALDEEPGDSRPTGTRLDVTPSLSLPQRGTAWFLTPKLALRHTQYQLDTAEDEELTRTLPLASVDGGLFFERDLNIGGRGLLQTLEPRLYYLYVPYEDQSALPLFDTGLYGTSYSQLFRENRFSGPDRMGDANQLTTAVTTRFIDPDNGAELLSASLGQIQYFADRRVQLNPDEEPLETASSEFVGELRSRPAPAWDVSASAVYDPHEEQTEEVTGRVRYNPAKRKNFTLSYRLLEPDLEQTDVSFFWPLARQWSVLGRSNYDLVEKRNLDEILGLEYQACCWSLRLITRSTLDTGTLEQERSVELLLELKGLTQIGSQLEEEVERGILGY
ncbi:LPS-assembly protein LptD [Thiohalomonas denitrificans]|uniref:LPS-assembly protein LptD n=1 Tax=Thiohalomonas denitrificans TaxID=415747 RepID=UPI00158608B5|nr:LPS-assembly protein LptD [Thiohalomonas denitrificans]